MIFTNEYEHTIDDKQRLAIPAEIRSRLNPEQHTNAWYLVLGANGTLWLWPERTFEAMAGALEQTLLPGEERMEYEELLFSQATRMEMDKAGRIRLPESKLVGAGLRQTVVILGVRDHLELRDPVVWKQQLQQKLAMQAEIMLRARNALHQQRQDE